MTDDHEPNEEYDGLGPDELGPDAWDPLERLNRDMRQAAGTMTSEEARFLVDYYYILQKDRVRTANQRKQLATAKEPHVLIAWLAQNVMTLETNVKSALGVYAAGQEEGRWALTQHGIGPVISAGLLAHVDIEKAKTVSSVWRFAGLDPTSKWLKGQKRPWNARLKVLCWHAGQCFKRSSGSEKSYYGKLYRSEKARVVAKNDEGGFAELAARTLTEKKFKDKATKALYEAGRLPAGRLDLMATRYAVKRFLSHYWAVSYEVHYKAKPEDPWIIAHGGHEHREDPPHWPLESPRKERDPE